MVVATCILVVLESPILVIQAARVSVVLESRILVLLHTYDLFQIVQVSIAITYVTKGLEPSIEFRCV